jgi:hypothetical protein
MPLLSESPFLASGVGLLLCGWIGVGMILISYCVMVSGAEPSAIRTHNTVPHNVQKYDV